MIKDCLGHAPRLTAQFHHAGSANRISRSNQVFRTLKLYLPLCIAGESSGSPAINPNPLMETSTNPVSKSRVLLTWLLMVGMIVGIMVFFFWRAAAIHPPPPEEPGTAPGPLVHSIISLIVGGFFLTLGLIGYFIVIFTGCFTFDYGRPVWNAVKAKKYVANIIVMVAVGLGLGFGLSAFVSPVLRSFGLDQQLANMAPLMVVLILFQVMQLWVLVWSPLEKRIIVKRLAAMGITLEHLQGATLVGLSNPASGLAKRFGAIEEDMGGLWITSQQLMFRGDVEQFDLSREEVVQIERRGDNRSTTALAGIAHVILHVRQPDGGTREIRLHVEGLWTMGQKKKVMNTLAEAINQWHAKAG